MRGQPKKTSIRKFSTTAPERGNARHDCCYKGRGCTRYLASKCKKKKLLSLQLMNIQRKSLTPSNLSTQISPRSISRISVTGSDAEGNSWRKGMGQDPHCYPKDETHTRIHGGSWRPATTGQLYEKVMQENLPVLCRQGVQNCY